MANNKTLVGHTEDVIHDGRFVVVAKPTRLLYV